MEVVPLKIPIFQAGLKLGIIKVALDTTKKLKGLEKLCNIYMDFINIIYLIPSIYFRVNLKMKKATLCYCFTWILFIEVNFTIASLLIRKTWDDWFASKIGGWGILRNGGILVMGYDFEMGGVDTLLRTMS